MSQNSKQIVRLRQKVDTRDNWNNSNIVLLDKEIAYERETGAYKIGNGIDVWKNLPYASLEGGNSEANLFAVGEGKNSIQNLNTNAKALGDYSLSLGYETIAGIKGYYYSSITFGEEILDTEGNGTGTFGPCVITLTKEQPTDITTAPTPEPFAVSYVVGDVISIINNSKYYRCATITSIENNIITVDSLPFNSIQNMVDELAVDDYNFFCPDKPFDGEISLGQGAYAEGQGSQALDRAAHAEGILCIAEGQYSHAEGRETKANYAAHSEGQETYAKGEYSHAEGIRTTAIGLNSHTEGYITEAVGRGAHAEGFNTHANGEYSHTEGQLNTASGNYAHAEGSSNKASGSSAHTEGRNGEATHDSAHSEGVGCKAIKDAAHAEGKSTIAEGYRSHAEGEGTHALGNNQHVQGKYNIPNSSYAHIVGNGTKATPSDAHTLDWNGNGCYAGNLYVQGASIANGKKVATEEYVTTTISNLNTSSGVGIPGSANKSEVFNGGVADKATGEFSHVEGFGSSASGSSSHAEGQATQAKAPSAHTENYKTIAEGYYSHAEGKQSETLDGARSAHAEGEYTKAAGVAQHVQGKYNIIDANKAHIVGNGTSDTARSNAHTLDWGGNAWFAGDITVGADKKKLATEDFIKAYVDEAILGGAW